VSTMSNFRRSTPFFLFTTRRSSSLWWGHRFDGFSRRRMTMSAMVALVPLFFLFLLCVYRGAMAIGLSKGRVRQKKKYGEKENHTMAWTPTRVLCLADVHCSSRGTVAFFFPFLYLVKNITLWSELRLMWISSQTERRALCIRGLHSSIQAMDQKVKF
jgi:hypothetical protein